MGNVRTPRRERILRILGALVQIDILGIVCSGNRLVKHVVHLYTVGVIIRTEVRHNVVHLIRHNIRAGAV